jgi:uncharacterized protein (DUF1810 family)
MASSEASSNAGGRRASSEQFSLGRFTSAQDEGGTYERASAELRAGRKQTHWMWFIFPQLSGLGASAMASRYAISSLAEAKAYLEDPVLGARLIECARILTDLRGRSAEDIFGATDAMKLRSSMTLFARAAPANAVFRKVLVDYFDGATDASTDRRLE